MNANVGLAIQSVGIVLIALLSLSMRGSIKGASLSYWTTAWICLSLALLSLFTGFHIAGEQKLFYSFYFFGEYAFGLMFVAGCRHHSTTAQITRRDLVFVIAAIVVAAVLPHLSADFNDLFMIQATILSILFAASYFSLRPALRTHKSSPGLRVMSAALILLTADFLHYVPVFGARKGLWGFTVPTVYLQYTSIFDLILETLLGFGTMMVLLEGVRREVEAANRELVKAHGKLELMARMDPLTEALNRHAFHSLLTCDDNGLETTVSGCVAVIDVDNLKPINDSFGHNVGDRVIRAVARGVRSLVRADDMLFRWGGDEFLVLMLNLPEREAERRMRSLNQILEKNSGQWTSSPVKITVSFGVAGFTSLNGLAQAIEQADRAMYSTRRQRRAKQEALSYAEPSIAIPN